MMTTVTLPVYNRTSDAVSWNYGVYITNIIKYLDIGMYMSIRLL